MAYHEQLGVEEGRGEDPLGFPSVDVEIELDEEIEESEFKQSMDNQVGFSLNISTAMKFPWLHPLFPHHAVMVISLCSW